MKRGITLLAALAALTMSALALDVVERPLDVGGYTYYAIDGDGTLWAWGDSFHGGITADRDLEWEEAVPEVKHARNTCAGFATGLAVDRDGVLWGFGSDHSGKLLGQDASQGAIQLMDHAVYAEVWDVCCCALKDDGTLWDWGGTDPETGKLFWAPHQVMDHVRAFWGGWVLLEDGTLLERWHNVDGKNTVENVPVAANVADMRYDHESQALLALGGDGNLYRAARDGNWYGPMELLLEDVVSFSNCTAVTADGTLWAWGTERPAILKEGEPDPADPYDANMPIQERAVPVKITEGIRYAESGDGCTLAILEDGSLWELPSAYHVSISEKYPQEQFPEVRTACRKLMDRAAPVIWLQGDRSAPGPVLLTEPVWEIPTEAFPEEPETPVEVRESEVQPAAAARTVSAWAALVSLLPVAAAVVWHLWKRT